MNDYLLRYLLLGFEINYKFNPKDRELLIKVSNDKVYATQIIKADDLLDNKEDNEGVIVQAVERAIIRINKM